MRAHCLTLVAVDSDEYIARLDAMVEEHGVAIQYVGSNGGETSFGYTVGLSLVPHADFILFALTPQLTQGILNDLAFAVLRGGMRFESGDHIHHVLRDLPVLLIDVEEPDRYLRLAIPTENPQSGRKQVRAIQVLTPDGNGRFPGDDGYADPAPPLLGQVNRAGPSKTLPDAATRRGQGW